jgi:dTDP-glucose 4,6-dehydratase
MKVLITGAAGFIGSSFVQMYLRGLFPEIDSLLILDKLTYAGNISNLSGMELNEAVTFIEGDICDRVKVNQLASSVDVILNFAAESHVDRSIESANEFVMTNIVGTQILLDAARTYSISRFIQVSTDEVYGTIDEGSWDETSPILPNSPYSASKASADLLVRSFHKTHNMNVNITRSSNNFGPRQNPEKLIPNSILRILNGEKVTLYGDGLNVRDWLFVEDHCFGIYLVLTKGIPGEIYNIGGGTELTNLELIKTLLSIFNRDESQIEFVSDRLGHDRRYSVNCDKIKSIGYQPSTKFKVDLEETIDWYVSKYE